jgi:seryl-tRNA(Sec) selenium transferase
LVSLLPEAAVADQVLLQVVLLQLLEVLVEEHLQRHQEQQEQETLQQLYQDKDILGDLAQQLQTLVEQEVGVLEVQVILPLRRQLGVLEDLEELIPISHPLLLGGQYQQQFFQLGNH